MIFDARVNRGLGQSAGTLLGLIFHNTVREARKGHRNALMALAMSIFQTLVMVGVFYVMMSVFGLRGTSVRGDFLVYIMSGIFLYMTHIKAMTAVMGSEGPASPIMHHLPMNTFIAITSAALSALYLQTLSMVVILYVYHVIWGTVAIDNPVMAYAMVLLSWFFGVATGMVLLALKPWFPDVAAIIAQLYQRANMIASGKMFLANSLPAHMLIMFDWNPLFHTIDQARGFAFLNYNPHFSSVTYPLIISGGVLVIGMMGEFYTRKHASISWTAKR